MKDHTVHKLGNMEIYFYSDGGVIIEQTSSDMDFDVVEILPHEVGELTDMLLRIGPPKEHG